MAEATYWSILKDQIIGNGVAPLYGMGQSYQKGHRDRQEFIGNLREQQNYFKSVVAHTLVDDMFGGQKGSIKETEGVGLQQFQYLDDLLGRGDWGAEPLQVEEFLKVILSLRGREKYERPEWIDQLLSEPTP